MRANIERIKKEYKNIGRPRERVSNFPIGHRDQEKSLVSSIENAATISAAICIDTIVWHTRLTGYALFISLVPRHVRSFDCWIKHVVVSGLVNIRAIYRRCKDGVRAVRKCEFSLKWLRDVAASFYPYILKKKKRFTLVYFWFLAKYICRTDDKRSLQQRLFASIRKM